MIPSSARVASWDPLGLYLLISMAGQCQGETHVQYTIVVCINSTRQYITYEAAAKQATIGRKDTRSSRVK